MARYRIPAGLSFQAQTPIGQAISNLGNVFANLPTAEERAFNAARAANANAEAALNQNRLNAASGIADTFRRALTPGEGVDPETHFRTMLPEIAAIAANAGQYGQIGDMSRVVGANLAGATPRLQSNAMLGAGNPMSSTPVGHAAELDQRTRGDNIRAGATITAARIASERSAAAQEAIANRTLVPVPDGNGGFRYVRSADAAGQPSPIPASEATLRGQTAVADRTLVPVRGADGQPTYARAVDAVGQPAMTAASPGTPPELTRLMQQRDALPQGHPDRSAYDQIIQRVAQGQNGISMTMPDGTRVQVGGAAGAAGTGNTPQAVNQITQGIRERQGVLDALDRFEATLDTAAAAPIGITGSDPTSLVGRAEGSVRRGIGTVIPGAIDEGSRRQAMLQQEARQFFNDYRRVVTGAAAPMAELSQLLLAVPTETDAGPVLRAKIGAMRAALQAVNARERAFLATGAGDPAANQEAFRRFAAANPISNDPAVREAFERVPGMQQYRQAAPAAAPPAASAPRQAPPGTTVVPTLPDGRIDRNALRPGTTYWDSATERRFQLAPNAQGVMMLPED